MSSLQRSAIYTSSAIARLGSLLFTGADLVLSCRDHGSRDPPRLSVGFGCGCTACHIHVYHKVVERALSPLLVASQAIPVFALAPLLVVWLGYGAASKVVMAAVIIFFPIAVSLLEGFKNCDKDYELLFNLMDATFWQKLRLLHWPWALPSFFAGLKMAVAVATIGAVIGEWVGAQKGLGYLMIQMNARLRADMVFASILWLTVIGMGLWGLVGLLENKVLYWKKED